MKFEPQSLHWSHEEITVHSGILKVSGEKSYHPYLSDDRSHNQKFVKVVMGEMLNEIPSIKEGSCCVIESDNCTCQYKSAEHFSDIQDLCNELEMVVISVFGIAAHSKGEVDHVGGLTKVAIRRQIAEGEFFENAEDMVYFLTKKYENKIHPSYFVKEIDSKMLEEERSISRLKVYHSVKRDLVLSKL